MLVGFAVAILVSPVVFAVLLTSDLSPRAKILIGGGLLVLLVTAPLVYLLFFGSS